MAILDQYGNPAQAFRKFSQGAEQVSSRPWQPVRLDDIDKLIPSYDRQTLVSVSRMILENFGPVKGAIRQIAMYSTGDAWKPKSMATSERWRKNAETLMSEQFYPLAEIRGGDFGTMLYQLSMLLDRDGEYFILLTDRGNGFPALQLIPSHRIRSSSYGSNGTEKIKEGRFTGNYITDGIIHAPTGQTIAYRYLNDDRETYTDIDASAMIHEFESDYPESRRGYPSITHGLNDIRDSMQSHEWERLNMLIRSSIALIESNESGVPDDDLPSRHFDDERGTDCPPKDTRVGYLDGGAVKHFRAGTGSKLEILKHENPGDMWENFNNRMIRFTLAGIPWPTEMTMGATGQGTAERKMIEQARRTIKDRQATLRKTARRCIGYAVKKMVKIGRIADSSDWWRWDFTMPPVLTIDDGRVSKAMLELWRAGVVSDEDMLADMGKDQEDYWPRKFAAAARKEQAFIDAQEAAGVKIDPRYKGMFTPNDMGPQEEKADKPQDDETDTDNED